MAESGKLGTNADRVWGTVLLGAQSIWFVVRWTLGGNPIDASLVGVIGFAWTAAFLALLWPASMREGSAIERGGRSRIALLVAGVFAFEMVVALVEPGFGWDEEFVLDAASRIASGGFAGLRESYEENAWLATRHPPFGTVVFAVAYALGGEILAVRVVSAAFAAGAVVACAHVGRSLYGDRVGRRAGGLLLAFPLFARLGGVVMTDVIVTFLVTAAIAVAVSRARDGGGNAGALLGLLVTAACLTKYTAVLVVPVLLGIYAVHGALGRRRTEIAVAALVVGAVGLAWLLAAWSWGTLEAQAGWIGRAAAVSSQGLFGRFSAGEMLATKLPSALGLYAVPAVALGLLEAVRRRDGAAWTLLLWIGGISIPLLLTLPDNRYFLPAFPALAIVGSLGVERLFREPQRALRFFLALCFCTVVFYALLPDARPVFLFDSLSRAGDGG